MKKLFEKIKNNKGKSAIVASIGSIAFLILGIACFACGYGFSLGWDVVLAWFSSRYALLVYVFLALWLFIASYLIYWGKLHEDE